MSFCPNCGTDVGEDANFCPVCGKYVGVIPVQPVVAEEAPKEEPVPEPESASVDPINTEPEPATKAGPETAEPFPKRIFIFALVSAGMIYLSGKVFIDNIKDLGKQSSAGQAGTIALMCFIMMCAAAGAVVFAALARKQLAAMGEKPSSGLGKATAIITKIAFPLSIVLASASGTFMLVEIIALLTGAVK